MSRLHWIEYPAAGRIAIMARPRADDWLELEVDAWKTAGIDLVVSLLEHEEVLELGLEREAGLCRSNGIDFVSFPIPDRGMPEFHQASQIARDLAAGLRGGRRSAEGPERHNAVHNGRPMNPGFGASRLHPGYALRHRRLVRLQPSARKRHIRLRQLMPAGKHLMIHPRSGALQHGLEERRIGGRRDRIALA